MMQAKPTSAAPLQSAERRKLIAVASGKGGVGKTWLSISLAHGLAQAARRVLLFDGDIGLANVDIQLGLEPGRDLGAAIARRHSLAETITPYAAGQFDVIAGRSGSGSLASLPFVQLRDLVTGLMTLAADYDAVILDLGAGIEQTVRYMAAQAGRCLVVTSDEPTALTDAYAFLKLAYKAEAEADLQVVVNMASSQREGERTYRTLRKACESFLGRTPSLAGVIQRDPKVRDAIRHQVPLAIRHPASPAALDVDALARQLARDGL